MTDRPLKLGVIAGERSGERLAVDVIHAIKAKTGNDVELVGVGGEELASLGLKSIFDPQDIALMGVSDVAKSLPRLMRHMGKAANVFVRERPDCILLVDSPDFSHRVAKKIKASDPHIPIVKYVAPTVWAWRPERAVKMKAHVDAVMALFPFEPEIMDKLDGPPTTYVGHPLAVDEGLLNVWKARAKRKASLSSDSINLLLLPGSRKSEIHSLISDMKAVVDSVVESGLAPSIRVPTLPRHEQLVHRLTADMPITPLITTSREAQLEAYQWADCALCASGTITLELALAGVPAVSIYRTDQMMRFALPMITAWTAALPNVIADRQVIPEFYDYTIRPGMIMRLLREMADPSTMRHKMMMAGYAEVGQRMATEQDPAEIAAEVVLNASASS